jgi:antitoxin HicB
LRLGVVSIQNANTQQDRLTMKYTIAIQWSDKDQCFVVLLPEFTDVMQPVTHEDTYDEAFKNAQEVLELLISPKIR